MSFLLPIATRLLGGAAAEGGAGRLAAFSLGRRSSKESNTSQGSTTSTDGISNYPKV